MKVPGGGNYFWSPVYLDDLAQVYIQALSGKGDGKAFIITDEMKAKSPKAVPKFIASLFMGSAMIEGMTTSRQSKNTLVKEVLGWKPSYNSFRQGFPSVLKELSL